LLLAQRGCRTSTVKQVPKCHDRMMPDHSGAGKFHDTADMFTHLRFVTVDCAVSAGGFIRLERAEVQALAGIINQLSAVHTGFDLGSVVIPAIYPHHCFDGCLLSVQ